MSRCEEHRADPPSQSARADETGDALTIDALLARWRYGVTRGTLANWRSKGAGPPWRRVGTTILYPVAGVEAYERDRTAGGRWWKPVRLSALIEEPPRRAGAAPQSPRADAPPRRGAKPRRPS